MHMTRRLGYQTGYHGLKDAAPRVFAELLELALPVLKGYRSDLYHDALTLSEMLTDDTQGVVFFYSFNESGTAMGKEGEYAPREHVYRVTVRNIDGSMQMEIEGA